MVAERVDYYTNVVLPETETKQMNRTELSPTDQKQFNELIGETYKKVFNLAFRLAGNRSDAEDLTQEAFYRAYRSFKDFEGDRPFENWIFRIVTRLFLDLMRTRRRRVNAVSYDAPIRVDAGDDVLSLEVADQNAGPEDHLLAMSVSEPMEQALDRLKPEQKVLVMLADVENLPYAEIAQTLGVPVGTVRSRLHRAHKQLRAALVGADSKVGPSSERVRLCATG